MKSPAVGWRRVGRLFQVGVFAAAALSCGDSGTGPSTTTTDETPPTVLSMDPAAGSFGASRTGAIRVTFSEPIAPATVNTTTFTVTSAGTGVPGSVSASGSVATFTPGAELATGALYEARVTTGITDVAGNALEFSVTWDFNVNSAPTLAVSGEVDATRSGTVTLDASGSSDPDPNQTLSFAWSQVAGTTVALSSVTAAAPTFTAPDEIGTLAFDLVVSDGAEQTTQRVTVWVLENSASHYWVSPNGSDANAGTRAAPFASIQFALDSASNASQGGDVYVAGGSYEGSLYLRSGVSIYGGYDAVTFLRDVAAHETEIVGSANAGVDAAVIGSGLSGSNPVALNALTIRAADGTTNGGTSIGIHLNDSPDVVITGNRIFAGSGGDGADGSPGVNGAAGTAGAFGRNASTFCADLPGGAGGSSPGIFSGGAGGRSGLDGRDGQGSALAGTGGLGNSYPSGVDGLNGHAPSSGSHGSPGASFGTISSYGSYSRASGGVGADGTSGGGGGGGGGGLGVLTACGGSGGGGGSGGIGGRGGQGGHGGGGSFGIMLTGTSTNITIANNEITTASGGASGDGAAGGSGGVGGAGRTGGNGANGSGAGGRGGNGGYGGRGGDGAGGGGGPSVGIVEAATASSNLTPTNVAGNTFTLGMSGTGGGTGAAGLRIEYTKR